MAETKVRDVAYAHMHEEWGGLSLEEKVRLFKELSTADAEEFFRELDAHEESELLAELPAREKRLWIRVLDPDDAADVIQEMEDEERETLLELLDASTRNEVTALLAYAEDEAGGLMSPRFTRLRPDMTVAEALNYLRKQAVEHVETIYYVYVLDATQHLMGVLSVRRLLSSPPEKRVAEVMRTSVITAPENTDQEDLSRLFAEYNLLAIPVVDAEERMKGIVTVDDIVDVVAEEATEDIQKMGGSEALGGPYLKVALSQMIKKRGGWLTLLFLGELLTANAMAHFEDKISKAVVLAVFIPLIISSGGNAGSQASTLVIRAMALGEVRLQDWLKVLQREIFVGMSLGVILGIFGFLRVLIWQQVFGDYGSHSLLLGLTVGIALTGIVLWGSLAGSILPFVLRKAGFDPASASTPFVATLVDVTGLLIYFGVASIILRGTLL